MIYYNVNKRKNPQTGSEKFYGTCVASFVGVLILSINQNSFSAVFAPPPLL